MEKLKIGKKEYFPIILAPMAGMADGAFRAICHAHGAGYSTTEMISAKAVCYDDKKTEALAEISESEGAVSCQLFGHEPDVIAQAEARMAEIYAKSGTKICSFDINMGCPVPKIVRSGDGSALMKNPALIGEIVSAAVKSAGDIPVTVKIRAGWDRSSINAAEVAKIAEECGAAAICVHGRTRSQMYEPSADWSIIRDVKNAVNIPVIGNGDVFCGADAVRMMDETGCDGVAVARGALGNPWIFEEISAATEGRTYIQPSKKQRIDGAIAHLRLAVERKGEYKGVVESRAHIGYYTKGLYGSPRVRGALNLAATEKEVEELLRGLAE